MSKATRRPAQRGLLCFTDSVGGAFAALAAAFAVAAGRDAGAASTIEPAIPAAIHEVLGEIGLTAPDVVLAAQIPAGAERVDASGWGAALYQGEGELERLAVARIARDRIERRVEALLATKP